MSRRVPALVLNLLAVALLSALPFVASAAASADGTSALPEVTADAAPALMLAQRWDDALDPARYWVSEKLDGVRAHWDGKRLRFRSGLPIPAPSWFVAALPARPLDGELWLGRGQFEALSGIVRRDSPDDAQWRKVRYMIFDLPGDPGTFSERVQRIDAVIAGQGKSAPWLQAVPQFRVRDRTALAARMAAIVQAGGEGLMLHHVDASWVPGRSEALRKLTPWLDAEARVIAHVPGKGRLAGSAGALLVEASDGRRFRIGSGLSDAVRRKPPQIGAMVTYRYRELTGQGLPRFPRFLRERVLP